MDISPALVVNTSVDNPVRASGMEQDAVSALVNLGYARGEAFEAVLKARAEANDNLQTLIRLALKALSA